MAGKDHQGTTGKGHSTISPMASFKKKAQLPSESKFKSNEQSRRNILLSIEHSRSHERIERSNGSRGSLERHHANSSIEHPSRRRSRNAGMNASRTRNTIGQSQQTISKAVPRD